jgi:Ca-activated chloride channel family protein
MRNRRRYGIWLTFSGIIIIAAFAWPREYHKRRAGSYNQAPSTPTPAPIGRDVVEEIPPRPPALLARVTERGPLEPLDVVKVDVEATIIGFLARTRMTITFDNPHPRILEGELVFPLPEGSTVSGYGLDVGGEIVDGVVVARREARVAFEKEVRKGVDPGLVEWIRGNVFRARVYPLPANGRRTIRIEYASDLITRSEDQAIAALYRLPLRFDKPISDFRLHVEVVRGAVSPEIRGEKWADVRFEHWEDRFVAETSRRDARLNQDLLVALPDVPRRNVVVEKTEDGAHFFVIEDFPPLPPPRRADLAKPKRVGLVWDASSSRAHGDHARIFGLVERWLERLGDVDVELTVLRDTVEKPMLFAIRRGESRTLLDHLAALPFDGATRMGALLFSKQCAYYVVVSDGLATLGDGSPRKSAVPVYTLTADAQADHALLRRIAQASGGQHFNLGRITDEEALDRIGRPEYALLSVETDADAVTDVLPSGRQPASGRVTICGRLKADKTQIALHYGWSDEGPSETRSYTVNREDLSGMTGLAPRLWAQRKVEELAVLAEEHDDELLALGRRFGIVTPGASLLVLETLEQHLEHGVEPAKSRRALREAYLKRVAERRALAEESKKDKLERVVAMWRERVSWWERKFEGRPPKLRITADVEARQREESLALETRGYASGVEDGVRGDVAAGLPEEITVNGAAPAPAVRLEMADATATRVMEKDKQGKSERDAAPGATITLKPWDPKTPYIDAMKKAGAARAYDAYLEERETHGDSPAFYLDCADFFLKTDRRDLARRILSNVVEMKLDEARLLRVAAHRFQQIGEHENAVELFARVLHLRPEEPQSPRDLALALSARADDRRERLGRISPSVAADYRRAIDLLYGIALGVWDERFPEIEVVVLMDMNRLVALLDRAGLEASTLVDPRLVRLLDLGLRVVLTWDTDMTDMDLWVTEPEGEKCYYSNRLTALGGRISRDFTGGYGPEEYALRRAIDGRYRVQANFYGTRAQRLTGPTTVQAVVVTDFGRPNEKRRALTVRLTEPRDVIDLGDVRVGGTPTTE